MGCYSENAVLAPEEALLLRERGGHGDEGVVCKLTGKYIDCQCGQKKKKSDGKRKGQWQVLFLCRKGKEDPADQTLDQRAEGQ